MNSRVVKIISCIPGYELLRKKKIAYDAKKNKNYQKILDHEISYSSNEIGEKCIATLSYKVKMRVHIIEKSFVTMEPNVNVIERNIDLLIKELNEIIILKEKKDESQTIVDLGISAIKLATDNNKISLEKRKRWEQFINKYDVNCVKPISIIKGERISEYMGYFDFCTKRYSVRKFKRTTISIEVIQDIIKIANLCPSACNRQPCKVYFTEDNTKVYDIRPDKTVTKEIYNYLIITVNKSLFSKNEVLWPWINAGIYLESLIMAIHSKGLGSCIFGNMKYSTTDCNFRRVAKIPDNEDIVAYIGFGELLDEYYVIEKHRDNENTLQLF